MTRFFPQPAKKIMKEMRRRAGLKVRLKVVVFKKRRCNVPKMDGKHAHAHCQEAYRFYGQICINPKFLEITPEHGIDYLMAHEVAHFLHYKHGKEHTELTQTLLGRQVFFPTEDAKL